MFPTGRIRSHDQRFQENAESARVSKKIINKHRAPLTDLAVNPTPQKSVEKLWKTKTDSMPNKKEDIFEDCCSYKEVEDTMEDIWPTAERFDFNKLRDRYNCKTPPFTHTPAEAEPIPMFIRFEDYILPPEKDVIEIPMHHE